MEIVLRARRAWPTTATITASSGNGVSALSQPCRDAKARKADTLPRLISRARAMSRSESPWRSRTRTARYWNISNLLRPTAHLPGQKSGRVAATRVSSRCPSLSLWPEYADQQLARLRRSAGGSNMPITRWLEYADYAVARICRSLTPGAPLRLPILLNRGAGVDLHPAQGLHRPAQNTRQRGVVPRLTRESVRSPLSDSNASWMRSGVRRRRAI